MLLSHCSWRQWLFQQSKTSDMKAYTLHLEINENLFLKDPQETKLGLQIIEQSVLLIDEIGLDQFTFKKLAKVISSSEASIYRYFENKHTLFVYLANWYWESILAKLQVKTLNIEDPLEKLKFAIDIIVDNSDKNLSVAYIDEEILHKIIICEGTKAYHHTLVDADNQDGFFLAYKRLCQYISDIIKTIAPQFEYPRALASTLVETTNNHLYFARHLPRLTDIKANNKGKSINQQVKEMMEFYVYTLLNCSSKTA